MLASEHVAVPRFSSPDVTFAVGKNERFRSCRAPSAHLLFSFKYSYQQTQRLARDIVGLSDSRHFFLAIMLDSKRLGTCDGGHHQFQWKPLWECSVSQAHCNILCTELWKPLHDGDSASSPTIWQKESLKLVLYYAVLLRGSHLFSSIHMSGIITSFQWFALLVWQNAGYAKRFWYWAELST